MNTVKKDVEELVVKELNSANEQFPLFASLHEGYAVMLEEVEEAESELEHVREKLYYIWQEIKLDGGLHVIPLSECVKEYAIDLACEAIQVAAMAEKVIVSGRKRNEKEICD